MSHGASEEQPRLRTRGEAATHLSCVHARVKKPKKKMMRNLGEARSTERVSVGCVCHRRRLFQDSGRTPGLPSVHAPEIGPLLDVMSVPVAAILREQPCARHVHLVGTYQL